MNSAMTQAKMLNISQVQQNTSSIISMAYQYKSLSDCFLPILKASPRVSCIYISSFIK